MRHYLLPEKGNFYKANMHMHTTVSDGKYTPEETKAAYKDKGYSIVAFTDHELLLPHNELRDENFLPITSHEISVDSQAPSYEFVHTYHLNLYSRDPDEFRMPVYSANYFWNKMKDSLTPENTVFETERVYSVDGVNDIIRTAKERGFIVCYNHFSWSLQNYNDYIGLEGLWGAECYNTGCVLEGYHRDGDISVVDDLLKVGKQVYPLATDDSHGDLDRFGGYTMIKAESLDYNHVFDALEKGDFYASSGPEIDELWLEDGILHVKCRGASELCVTTERRAAWRHTATDGGELDVVEIDMKGYIDRSDRTIEGVGRPFFRVTLRAPDGKAAYTRGYFIDEL